ncbi:MAG TPA: hypothetical protein VKZ70_14650 [Burkholderiaceae bacterium]|nr:hypothetical protein [Burkholderiaceae bacterium]
MARQLALSLDRWPVPLPDGSYDRESAHRYGFEQRCGGGRVCINLLVLEVVPDLYIQASEIILGEICKSTALRLSARNRFDSPEAALLASVNRAARELKQSRRASGLYPEYQTTLLRATNWMEDIMQQCDYLLERQAKLFSW